MPRRFVFAAVALALAAVVAAGCSKRKFTTDPSYTLPEGTPASELELITFFDAPSLKVRMRDRGQIGRVDVGFDPATVDSIQRDATGALLITPVQTFAPGTVRGIVLNRTAAEGIEVYRTEPNGAVRRIFDFAVQPSRRWLDRNAEIYEFYDDDPHRPSGATYYVRGLIGGIGGPQSPLSNPSRPVPTAIEEIRYLGERWGTFDGGQPFEADSLIEMQWTPVAGASRYLIHVFEYQARALSLRERILTGVPSPILTLGQRDIFVASVPGSFTQYKMLDPGATIYTFRAPRMRLDYYVRITAIDANSQMIATTTGVVIDETRDLNQLFRWPRDNTVKDFYADFSDPEVVGATPAAYLLYTRGAAWVSPGSEPNPTTAMERTR